MDSKGTKSSFLCLADIKLMEGMVCGESSFLLIPSNLEILFSPKLGGTGGNGMWVDDFLIKITIFPFVYDRWKPPH